MNAAPLFSRLSRRLTGAFCALCLGLLVLTSQLDAGSAIITDRHVQGRITLMTGQKAALITLSDMVAGRTPYNAASARAARRALISATGSIPKRFRKQRMEPNSHARPEIWLQWTDFKQRAETARLMAKEINSRSVTGLRRTIPPMIEACHSCHQTYRGTPNRAITH
jgi:cytochrome c556